MTFSSKTVLHCLSNSQNQWIFAGSLAPINLVLPRHTLSNFTVRVSLWRNNGPAIASSSSKKKKKSLSRKDDDDDDNDDLQDDPLEALFSQLEDDLKNGDSTVDDDDEINDENLDKLALELEEALGDIDMEIFNTATEEEEREVRLKNRSKVLLRTFVLIGLFLKCFVNPSNLVMLSSALPNERACAVLVHEIKRTETIMAETTVLAVEPTTKLEEPVHDRQHRWSAQKRLKKVQVETLEMGYRRSKQPAGSKVFSALMLQIVHWKKFLFLFKV